MTRPTRANDVAVASTATLIPAAPVPGQAGPLPSEPPTPGEPTVEFITSIRGREVSCRLEHGRLVGDAELVTRVARLRRNSEPLGTVALARLVGDAVGAPVTMRLGERPTQG